MNKLLFLLLLPTLCYGNLVTIGFTPPVEYADDTVLLDSEITRYKYFIRNGVTGEQFLGEFENTGNMTEFEIDLEDGRYVVCMYAKAALWSENYNCSVFTVAPMSPPNICDK